VWSSSQLCRALGRRLSEIPEGPGIPRSAFEKDVPIFIPASSDSEMGFDVSTWAMFRAPRIPSDDENSPESLTPDEVFQAVPSFNPFVDLQPYARLIGRVESLGIFAIGGGVPRNWEQ
jgi:deoxyhypusine synthase